jgi:tripeptide aminopeptidase
MINAIRLAAAFLMRLPADAAPETTSGRQSFIHPYGLEGTVAEARIKLILRSFDSSHLSVQADLLSEIAQDLQKEYPGSAVDVQIRKQYRNMREALSAEPRAVGLAEEAMRKAQLEPRLAAIRGGTDGARLSELGLPTPNLGVGMHNFHSPFEYACLTEMERTVEVLLELAALWSREKL